MYCLCGSTRELRMRQEKQQGQSVGETVNYMHCEDCGRNHLPNKEKQKMKELGLYGEVRDEL